MKTLNVSFALLPKSFLANPNHLQLLQRIAEAAAYVTAIASSSGVASAVRPPFDPRWGEGVFDHYAKRIADIMEISEFIQFVIKDDEDPNCVGLLVNFWDSKGISQGPVAERFLILTGLDGIRLFTDYRPPLRRNVGTLFAAH